MINHLMRIAVMMHISLGMWVLFWHVWLAPSSLLPTTFMLGLWLPLLLIPLPGLLYQRLYTFRWVNFCLIPYIMHSVTLLVTQTAPIWLCLGELLLTLSAFTLNLWVVRASMKSRLQA